MSFFKVFKDKQLYTKIKLTLPASVLGGWYLR